MNRQQGSGGVAVSSRTPPRPVGMRPHTAPAPAPTRVAAAPPTGVTPPVAPVLAASAAAPPERSTNHSTPRSLAARTTRDQERAPGTGSPRHLSPVRVQDPSHQISSAVAKVLALGGPSSHSRPSLGTERLNHSGESMERMPQAPVHMGAPAGAHAMSPPRPPVLGGPSACSPGMLHRHTPWSPALGARGQQAASPGMAASPHGGGVVNGVAGLALAHAHSPRSRAQSPATGPRALGMIPFYGQAASQPILR